MRETKCVTFFAGGAQFAADAACVSEVFRRPRITRVPGGPKSLLGITALRGAAAPVVSLARLLGREDQDGPEARLLLLDGGQASGHAVGLAVDRVGAMASLAVPEADAGAANGFGGLYAVQDGTLRLLDIAALLQRDFAGAVAARKIEGADAADAAPAPAPDTSTALLSFELAGQAYALRLDTVSEVLRLPAHISSIAQSDAAALGVVALRGALLPVVSLRHLLGLAGAHGAEASVVITRIGDARVGLVVDRLGDIVRAGAGDIDTAPAVLNRGAGEAQVQSICRRPDGAGLIAILSGERLFRDEKLARILADGRHEGGGDMADGQQEEAAGRYLIFSVGGEEYGLPLEAVNEIVRLPEKLSRIPKAPGFVKGVLNVRGRIVPVIDQRGRFGAAHDGGGKPRIIITTLEGRQAGFIVDTVTELLDLAAGQIVATPAMTEDASRIFSRIATLNAGGRLILLVDPQEMLDRAERDTLAGFDTAPAPPEL